MAFFRDDNGLLCSSVSLRVRQITECSSAAREPRCSYKGSAILPSADHRGVPLLALWHNWQTARCHLTPLFQCGLFPSSLLPNEKKGGERGSLSSNVGLGFFAVTLHWAVWLGKKKKLLHTELHISGSGSANVGDRGIWGLKPLYLPSYKSCFIAYTSALANMICIVTSLPAGELYLIYADAVTGPVQRLCCFCARRPLTWKESAKVLRLWRYTNELT